MGFRDRLENVRRTQAAEQQVYAERTKCEHDRKLVSARDAAFALLPEVREAVDALRLDRERSESSLMSFREPELRGTWGLGAIITEADVREDGRLFRRTIRRKQFAGWWVRRVPFEFEVPLVGEPRVGIFQDMNYFVGPKQTLEAFAEGGMYEYRASATSYEGTETREASAVDGFREFLGDVMEHLSMLH